MSFTKILLLSTTALYFQCSISKKEDCFPKIEKCEALKLLEQKIYRVISDTFSFHFINPVSEINPDYETERIKEYKAFLKITRGYKDSDCKLTKADIINVLGKSSFINISGKYTNGEMWFYILDFGKNCNNYKNEEEVACSLLIFKFDNNVTLQEITDYSLYWDIEPNSW